MSEELYSILSQNVKSSMLCFSCVKQQLPLYFQEIMQYLVHCVV